MNNIDETGMPTDAYITVNANGIFIDGKPATKYRGQNIWDVPYIKECFEWMQGQNPDIEEFHIGAFETPGEFARSGNPSSGFGPHAWCRLKFKNGKYGAWVFSYTYSSAAGCANRCAFYCAFNVRSYAGFCTAVFRAPIDKTPQPKTPMENKQQNNDMPTDAYITVNANGIFIDGKPATKYRGQNIWDVPYIKECFEWMQGQNPDIEEFHIGAFETPGEFARSGNPSSGFGPHAWCRLKFKNGKYGAWVFNYTYGSAAGCADYCAYGCAGDVRRNAGFRATVFNAPIDKTPQPKTPMENKQQNNDMPTDAYITVKRNEKGEVDIYVGGKPATTYRGQNIWDVPYIKECFEWMQAQNPDIEEFHIGAFATRKTGQTGNPSSGFGPHAWCRLKFKNGKYGSWVFDYTNNSAAACASFCARNCAGGVRVNAGFRAAVFNAPIAKTVENPTVEIDGKGLAQFIVNSVYGKQK